MPPRRTTKPAYKPRTRTVKGYGDYTSAKPRKTKTKKAPRKESSGGGWLAPALSGIGGTILGPIGGTIGSGLGSLIKTVTGFGDYEVTENSLMNPSPEGPPVIQNSPGKNTILRHREYISDVITSAVPGEFKVDNYYIQPGDPKSFPWLSGIADSFESYRIRGMIYEFKTMSSDALNSTNTALGQVILATQYNSSLPNFQSAIEMQNYEFSSTCKPSLSVSHAVECDASQCPIPHLYVRTTNNPPGSDRRLYDFGNFQIASSGMQAASVNIGQLWVTYEIELYKPKVHLDQGLFIPYAYINHASVSGLTATEPFGPVRKDADYNTTFTEMFAQSNGLFIKGVNAGDYMVQIEWRSPDANLSLTRDHSFPQWGALVNCTLLGTSVIGPNVVDPDTAFTDNFIYNMAFRVTGYNKDVTIGLTMGSIPSESASISNANQMSVRVIQIPKGEYM